MTMESTPRKTVTLRLKDKLYNLSERPLVMGIMNVTPDSFFSLSRTAKQEDAIAARADRLVSEGADIIDLGGYSTRPGAPEVSPEEEWSRVETALKVLCQRYPEVPVSLDTFRADIAAHAVEEYGVAIVNDVSGGTLDPNMFSTMAHLQVPYILMHMRGTPETMAHLTDYEDVTLDVIRDLQEKKNNLRRAGFTADIIMDPGFGFSKDRAQNFEMMRRLDEFSILEDPLLVGISRKRMIWGLLGNTAEEALNGTTVLNTMALLGGAHILRVHDVKEAVEVVKLVEAFNGK